MKTTRMTPTTPDLPHPFRTKYGTAYCDAPSRLQVGLVPAPDPMHETHAVRVPLSRNPDWYRELAARCSWPRPVKVRSCIKRRDVARTLARLAQGDLPDNRYVPHLLDLAEGGQSDV